MCPRQFSFNSDKPFPDTLPSSLITSDSTPQRRLKHREVPELFPLDDLKEDDFLLSPLEDPKTIHQEQQQNSFNFHPKNQAQFEIIFEQGEQKHQEYDLENERIARSRGPSFHHQGGEMYGDELFMNAKIDFKQLFCKSEKGGNDHFERHEEQTNFTLIQEDEDSLRENNFQGYSTKSQTNEFDQTNQFEVFQKFEQGFVHEESNFCLKENSALNDSSFLEENLHKIKKKLKLSNGDSVNIEQNNSTLKKIKGKTQKSLKKSLSNPKALKEPKKKRESPQKPKEKSAKKPKAKQQSDLIINQTPEEQSPEEAKLKDQIDESTTTTTDTKTEDLSTTTASKSKSIIEAASPPKSKLCNFFEGLKLPPEVEELICKSKIFQNIQLLAVKKIGPLTIEERQAKVAKYLQKRKDRKWSKRINYDCRKRVADSRLRFKGRFVTKTQIQAMLEEEGIYRDLNKMTDAEIKELLENSFEKETLNEKINEKIKLRKSPKDNKKVTIGK